MDPKCSTCDIVGIKSSKHLITQDLQNIDVKISRKRRKVAETKVPKKGKKVYHLANGVTTVDELEAKQYLLRRDYPKIASLENTDLVSPGSIGYNSLPNFFLTQIPKIVEPEKYEEMSAFKNLTISEKVIGQIAKEGAEMAVIDGIETYFKKHDSEDVFVLFNQDVQDKEKNRWLERDAIVINLSRGYVMVIEAKASLRTDPRSKGRCIEGSNQLLAMLEVIKNNAAKLNQDWKIIHILFGTVIDQDHFPYCCANCKPFIMTQDDFGIQLESALENVRLLDANEMKEYATDFLFLVKEFLPLKLRIDNKMTNLFDSSKTFPSKAILGKVSKNMEELGQPENIAFWSPSQFDIANHCLDMKRVLFCSAFSTGKTTLMVYCAEKLLEKGEKVMFVINRSNDLPSLLKLRLRCHFAQHENVKIIMYNLNEDDAFDELIANHAEYNVLCDEVEFGFLGANYETLENWSKKVSSDKHLWIVLCYGKDGNQQDTENFDPNKLDKEAFPIAPILKYPMRNPKTIVEFVQSKRQAYSVMSEFNDTLMIEDLIVPPNLTRTFNPENLMVRANHFAESFEKILGVFSSKIDIDQGALIVAPKILNRSTFCSCYESRFCDDQEMIDKQSADEFTDFVREIYSESGRQDPCFYIQESDIPKAQDWVDGRNDKKDLITDYKLVNGFESEIVVLFQDNHPDHFEHNMSLRATSVLIIVKVPETHLRNVCFGKCFKELIKLFVNETRSDENVAKQILSKNEWILEASVNEFFQEETDELVKRTGLHSVIVQSAFRDTGWDFDAALKILLKKPN